MGGIKNFTVGGDSPHHFHQLHQRNGIEEMQPHKAIRPLGRRRDFRNRDGRSVAGKDCVFLHDRVQRGEHLLLFFRILNDGFNNDVAMRQGTTVRRALQPRADSLRRLLQFAFLGKLGQRFFNPGKTFVEKLLLLLQHRHVIAGSRRNLRNAGPHQATAQYANFLNVHSSISLSESATAKSEEST